MPSPTAAFQPTRSLWLGYAGLCVLCWLLYAMAGAEWLRGGWRAWQAAYEATWNLGPPMLLGTAVLPWVRWLQSTPRPLGPRLVAHAGAATVFALLWHGLDYTLAWSLFGLDHANATLEQQLLWRSTWAVFVYTAMVLGFGGVLHARRAQAAALSVAQAESALVRAELAAISGKLNPHFLFNTLNTLILLTRKDAREAERGLMGFARLLRYLLDSQRGAADRVALQEELDFVRDYLALEALRLGDRLRVEWRIDAATVDDPVPPLTLQPLVENAIQHGVAPRVEGGTVRLASRRLPDGGLYLSVGDDGAGAVWPPASASANTTATATASGRTGRDAARSEQASRPAGSGATVGNGSGPGSVPSGATDHRPGRDELRRGHGIGLAALQRRFALDYGGRARFTVDTAPGAGFRVDIVIPPDDDETVAAAAPQPPLSPRQEGAPA